MTSVHNLTDKASTSPLHMDHRFLRWDALRAHLASNETTLRYTRHEGSTVVLVQKDKDGPASEMLESPVRLIHVPCAFGLSSRGYPLASLLTSAKAAMMAAYDFNHRRPTIVPDLDKTLQACNVHMTLDFYDTERSVIPGATVLTEYIHPRPFPYEASAVVGAVRSAVSIPMSLLNSIVGIPQVSYASTSSDLNDRASNPLFGRVLPSTDGDAAAALDYFVNVLGTTHLGILYVKDSYGTAYQLSLESAANQMSVETKSIAIDWSNDAPDFEEKMRNAINRLNDTGFRHFVGILYHTHLGACVRVGREVGVVGPGKIWIFSDGISTATISSEFGASAEPMSYHGMGRIAVGNPIDGTQTDHFMAHYNALDDDAEFREYFAFKTPLHTDKVVFQQNTSFRFPSHYAPLMYDAVMSLGIAACRTQSEFFNGTELFDAFLKSEFVGASGPVSIDAETGSRRFNSSAYVVTGTQVVGPDQNDEYQLELYSASGYVVEQREDGSIQNKWTTPDGVRFNYSDFTLEPPPPLPPLEPVFDPIPSGVRGTALSLAGLVAVSAVVFAGWTIKHRKDYVVKASQPGFLLVVGLGCFLMSASVLFIVIDSPPMSENFVRLSCMFGYWPFCIGFSLAFGGLFAKTWRINKILEASTSFRRVVVSPRDVILPSAVFLAGNLIVLTLWQIIAPLQFKREFDLDGSVDEYGRPNSSYATCESENMLSDLFLLLIFLLNGAAVVAANVQVYRARRITTEFSESRFISIAMAITLQALLLSLPAFLLDASITIRAMARSFVVILCSGSILFLVFVPKIMYLRAYEKDRLARQRRLAERRRLASGDSPLVEEVASDDIIPVEFSGEENIAADEEKQMSCPSSCAKKNGIGMEVFVAETVVLPRRHYSDSSSGLRISSSHKSSSEFPAQSSTSSFAGNSGPMVRSNRDNRNVEKTTSFVKGDDQQTVGDKDRYSGCLSRSSSRMEQEAAPNGIEEVSEGTSEVLYPEA